MDALVEWALDSYVRPVLFARIGNGSWAEERALASFAVDLEAIPVRIRINDEERGWTQARASRSIGPGEQIAPTDLISEQVDLTDLAGRRVEGRFVDGAWAIDARLWTRHPATEPTFDAGAGFVQAAKLLHEGANTQRALVECAFHAVELLAKAELMAYGPVVEDFAVAKSHSAVHGAYNSWAKLGNTDPDSAKLLNQLDNLRQDATYLRREFTLTADAASAIIRRLDTMLERVRLILDDKGPRIVRLVSHRAIDAGEMISKGDVGIRPSRLTRD